MCAGSQEYFMARLKQRVWRYGAVIGPVVALALSLEAGRRWF
jgi:hypothetical protein